MSSTNQKAISGLLLSPFCFQQHFSSFHQLPFVLTEDAVVDNIALYVFCREHHMLYFQSNTNGLCARQNEL